MMRKRTARGIALVMLAAGIGFIWYALNHPEASWPWSNTVSYTLYSVYFLIMLFLFAAPFGKNLFK